MGSLIPVAVLERPFCPLCLLPHGQGLESPSRQGHAQAPGQRLGNQTSEHRRFLLLLSQSQADSSSEIPGPRKTKGLMEETQQFRYQESHRSQQPEAAVSFPPEAIHEVTNSETLRPRYVLRLAPGHGSTLLTRRPPFIQPSGYFRSPKARRTKLCSSGR